MDLRSKENLYLIQKTEKEITGHKLPSNLQVLRTLFYFMNHEQRDLRASATAVIAMTEEFWARAKLPVRRTQKSVEKLEKLYSDYITLRKQKNRRSESQIKKENAFLNKLENFIFDIAHGDALKMITIEEDRQFLINQRKEKRPGHMSTVDTHLVRKEERMKLRQTKEEIRQKRATEEKNILDQKAMLISTSGSGSAENSSDVPTVFPTSSQAPIAPSVTPKGKKKPSVTTKEKKKHFMNANLANTFDRCKVSDRDAVRILTATIDALGLNPDHYVINRSSLRRERLKIRSTEFEKIRSVFKNSTRNSIVIHWDGKLLPDPTPGVKSKVERLPIIATYQGQEQLLGVPIIDSSSGKNQADAIYEILEEWNITDKVQALCSDTTASNTGRLSGACLLIEQKLDRELLYFPCRHHILEVVLRGVFEATLEKSSGPDVPIFKKFQNAWTEMRTNDFQAGTDDPYISDYLYVGEDDHIIDFCENELNNRHPREDYAELLKLTIMFLGGEKKRIRTPGAFHHARWMAKAIYVLKIFMFRNQFPLNPEEFTSIRDISLFIVKIYVRYWVQSNSAISAPRLDFEFLEDISSYDYINPNISEIALNKFSNHLWYLTPENVAFAFFDKNVTSEMKEAMVESLEYENNNDVLFKRIPLPDNIHGLDQFVNKDTRRFFSRFGIETTFLEKDPDLWESDPNYIIGKNIASGLSVVNDVAERGVKLITDYNKLLTVDENQKQYLIQVVANHRKLYPDVKRETLRVG